MKIKMIDTANPEASFEFDVSVIVNLEDSFEFKSYKFPPPALGVKFFVGGREIEVTEVEQTIEKGKAVFHFSAIFLPQP